MSKPREGVHYAWLIVLCGLLLMMIPFAIINNSASQFLKPITADLGFSRQSFSLVTLLVSSMLMGFSLCAGWLYARFGVMRTLRACAVLMPGAYFCFSLCASLPMFYLCALAVGFCLGGVTNVPVSLLINNWFNEKRGLAIGIAFMGTGLGGMIFNPLAAALIEGLGWRMTYRIFSALIAASVFPVLLFIREKPADLGLTPYGDSAVVGPSREASGLTLAQARRQPTFWLLCLLAGTASLTGNTLMQNQTPYLTDLGYPAAVAARVVSACMGALAVGKILLGLIFDKLGARRGSLLACSMLVLGLSCVSQIFRSSLLFVPLVACCGLGCAYGSVGPPLITQRLFGRRDYSAIYGMVNAIGNLGNALSLFCINAVYDNLGSYLPGYYALIAIALLMTVAFDRLLTRPPLQA